jgi:hypothetical protein
VNNGTHYFYEIFVECETLRNPLIPCRVFFPQIIAYICLPNVRENREHKLMKPPSKGAENDFK